MPIEAIVGRVEMSMDSPKPQYTAEECADYARNVLRKLSLSDLRKQILECFKENCKKENQKHG